MKKIVLACMVLAVMASGCLKDNSGNQCNFDECAFQVPATEVQQVQDYLTSINTTATQHCSGLFYTIQDPGTGQSPTVCNAVAVNYSGMLTSGETFDASTSPVTFNLNGLIGAWQLGIPLIKTGGKIRLYVPPSLGYGSQGYNTIPPNAVLIFDVELLAVY